MAGFRPNEQMRLPGLGVPVDPRTGELLTPTVLARMARLKDAEAVVRQIFHELDGSTVGSPPGHRGMVHAFNKLDEAMMWAAASVLGHAGD